MKPISFRHSAFVLTVAASAALTGLTGCGNKNDEFARVNGQVITKDEYMHALERIPANSGNPTQPINAGRLVLDQIIGKKVILSQAAKLGVVPSDKDIESVFESRKKLYELSFPGKPFEEALKEQGTSAPEIKDELKYQLAETQMLAKRLDIKEDEYKKAYEQQKSQMGLPERVQLRVLVAPNGSKEATEIAQQMKSGTADFAALAAKTNPAQFKKDGGLLPQASPIASLPKEWQDKIKATKEGGVFGPVEWVQPGAKAWIKVEKKMEAFTLPFEEAKSTLMQQLVQQRLMDPKNAALRNEIMNQKLQAEFQPKETRYNEMWSAMKKNYSDMNPEDGVGAGAGMPMGGAQ